MFLLENLLLSNDWKVKLLSGVNANEFKVKSISSPKLLHVATHGFFLPDKQITNLSDQSIPNEEIKKNYEQNQPYLRSGILLSGAQNTIENNLQGANNGIMSAYEAKNLNLDNTDLVVLSACETGRGKFVTGEGVFGLQRAFLEAGAKTVIMTLWKVDDQVTSELMGLFYTNWIGNKQSKREALKNAQISIKEKYHSPYYWGPFVLVGQ